MQNFDSLALTSFEPLTLTAQVAKICYWCPTIDSTNSEARRRAPEIATQLEPGDIAVLVAEQQTAGRGRMERTWHTIPGESLAVSFVTRLPRELLFGKHGTWLTTLAGIALLEAATDTISDLFGQSERDYSKRSAIFSCSSSSSLPHSSSSISPFSSTVSSVGSAPRHSVPLSEPLIQCNNDYHFQLKWPNDLICRGKKIAGILTESVTAPGPLVIFGIGFNLTVPPEQLPTDFATSLHLHYELPSDNSDLRDLLASKIVTHLSAHLREFHTNPEKHCALLQETATKFSYTLGKPVSVSLPNGESLQGVATRILPNAGLEIRTPNGLREITIGDVNAC